MPETPARYGSETEAAARARLEAYALRAVLDLAEADRPEACAKLEAAAYALRPWLVAVRREVDAAPAVGLPALWAVLDRRGMEADRAALDAAGVDLPRLQALDPADGRGAYDAALRDTARAGMVARARSARLLLDGVEDAKTDTERRALVADALHELTRPEAEGDAPLADAWQAHLDRMEADKAGPDEVLRLDAGKRGPWADWFNDWLGIRAGMEPGETFILGGAPEAGKTSLAALFAVDALAAGCPVLFWQLELSREETLEHLQAQLPEPAGWWKEKFWNHARRPLPPAWADLLTVPRWPAPEVEAVRDAMLTMTRQADRAARNGMPRHACKGLVIVDYAQLLTVADAGPRLAGHEILCTAASRLAKAAAENGACLLLLSQMNKQDQKEATAGGTALAGADLARMAHRVAFMQKANDAGKACAAGDEVAWDAGKGEARLLSWTKARGVRYTPEGCRPDRARVIWNGGRSRALNDGDAAGRKGVFNYE
jgi:hypothetical protein